MRYARDMLAPLTARSPWVHHVVAWAKKFESLSCTLWVRSEIITGLVRCSLVLILVVRRLYSCIGRVDCPVLGM